MDIIQTEVAFREKIAQQKLTVIVFKTTWCKDCHYIEPFMPSVQQHYADKIDFYEVDRDQLPDLCSEYNILGIPSFIAFRNGQEIIRFVNKLRKDRAEIEQFLDRALQVSEAL